MEALCYITLGAVPGIAAGILIYRRRILVAMRRNPSLTSVQLWNAAKQEVQE